MRQSSRRSLTGGARQQALPQYPTRMPSDAADRGEQQALGEELADQTAARRTHREPDRDLFLPRRRPREQQVGDIGAHDQEHEHDDGGENADRPGKSVVLASYTPWLPESTRRLGISLRSRFREFAALRRPTATRGRNRARRGPVC